MAIDGAIVDEHVFVIGGVHQLIAAFDHAEALGERFEDQEFGDRERDRLPAPGHFVARRVHRQATAHDGFGQGFVCGFARRDPLGQVRTAQDRSDPGDQKALAERLGDIVVGTAGQAQRLIRLVVFAGQKDHRQQRPCACGFAQAAKQFQPIHPRHLDVEDRQIGWIFAQRL